MIVAAAASLVLFAGCAAPAPASTPSPKGADGNFMVDGKPTELSYWSFTTGSQQAIDAFNASRDDIHVTYTQIPAGNNGGYSKLFNAFKAGNGPDVFNVEYPFLPDFVSQGYLADVTPALTSEIKKQFLPQALDLTTLGGKTYGIPYDLGVQLLYYRSDLFAQYGLTVPKTWEEFRATAEKLKAEAPGTYLTPTVGDDGVTLSALAWQAGASWFSTKGDTWKVNFEDKATKKVADYWQGMIADGLVSDTPNNAQAVNAALSSGTIISQISASWNAAHMPTNFPDQAGKWAIAPLPSWGDEPASGMNGGSAWAINRDSKSIDASIVLSTWLSTSEAGVKARVDTGVSSPYLAATALNSLPARYAPLDYYSGQDIYAVFDTQGHGLKPWTWGPNMTSNFNAMNDALGSVSHGGSILDGFAAGQKDAITQLKSRGLKVTNG